MGKLVADIKELNTKSLYNQYKTLYMQALSLKNTGKNANVLKYLEGHFKKLLSKDEKQGFQEVIDQYHKIITPLIVPITLFKHYIRKYDQEYLKNLTLTLIK